MSKKFISLAKNVIDLEIKALQKLKKSINSSFNKAVIEIAKNEGINVIERDIYPDEISKAEEIFLTGSAVEVTPVGKIDNQNFKVGDITTKISSLYMKEVDPNYEDND